MNYFMKPAIAIILLITVFALPETKAEELPKPSDIPVFMFNTYEKNKTAFLTNVLIEAEELHFDEKGIPSPTARYTFKAGSQRFLASENNLKKPSDNKYVRVGGPDGFFVVEQKPDQKGSVLVRKLSPTVEKFHGVCRADQGVGMQLATFEAPIYKYLTLPDLKVESVQREKWGADHLACVATSRTIKGGVSEKFYFDPEHDWVFRGSKRKMAQAKGYEAIDQVFYKEDGVTPIRWEYKTQEPDGSVKMLRVLNITQYQKKAFPDSEFSLTQFGLPDPTNPGAGNNLRYLWWLLIAAGLISLAALFRHLSNKKNAQTIQPT